jgi:putative MFS transporter
MNFKLLKSLFTPAVIVAALGYFVDIFDLLLFSIVRKTSLGDLGLDEASQITTGLMLHNLQMVGMLIGGVVWGVWADKKGRLSVLFGSIFLYSIGNIANGFVHDVTTYAICRIISGIGLAGELGAGITLVAETLPKDKRGYGTMIVATIGVSGAVVAGLIGEYFHWRTTYFIGGGLGLMLLLLRINTAESLLFQNLNEQSTHTRGQFLSVFKKRERFFRFLNSILIAVPIWFVIGTLIQLAPEFAQYLNVTEQITAGRAVMWSYAGLVFGDFASGALSQFLKSRKKAINIFIVGLFFSVLAYFVLGANASAQLFYSLCFILGFFAGYWAVFVTIAAEQFGTNLRATIATSAPNFVRASVVPMSLAFTYFKSFTDMKSAALMVGISTIVISFIANQFLKETFDQDLHFFEVD